MRASGLEWLVSLGVVATLAACSAPPGPGGESTGTSGAKIIGGTQASSYPEAALLDIYQGGGIVAGCSGSIIGPGVALTAGHCVYGWDGWDVLVPYNGGQKVHASMGVTYDWKTMAKQVDPSLHDVGLVFLDSQIHVTSSQCPVLAQKAVKSNSNVVNIGRIDNGQLSYSDLFVSAPTAVTVDGPSGGYPFDYEAQDYIQEGDSGGPDEVPGSSPHEIVAVNSGAGSNEVLARVDLVYTWIEQQAQSHGGLCGVTAVPDAGSGSSSGSGGGSHDAGTVDDGGAGGTSGNPDGGGSKGMSGWGNNAQAGSSGGCDVVQAGTRSPGMLSLFAFAGIAAAAGRRRRR